MVVRRALGRAHDLRLRQVVRVFSVHVPKAGHSLTDAETAVLLDLATRPGI